MKVSVNTESSLYVWGWNWDKRKDRFHLFCLQRSRITEHTLRQTVANKVVLKHKMLIFQNKNITEKLLSIFENLFIVLVCRRKLDSHIYSSIPSVTICRLGWNVWRKAGLTHICSWIREMYCTSLFQIEVNIILYSTSQLNQLQFSNG